MFESVLASSHEKKQEEKQIAAELRQLDYSHQQQIDASATDPNDDQNYMINQDKKSDLIRWQQELEPEMYRMVLSLQGLSETDKGVTRIIDEKGKPIPPACNKLFIYQVVIPLLKPFISKNLINSHLDDSEIRRMQETTMNDLADQMADNWDKYGIEFNNYDGIIRNMKNVVKASIWRSYKGWTKKVDSSMIKRIESEKFGGHDKSEDKNGIKSLFT